MAKLKKFIAPQKLIGVDVAFGPKQILNYVPDFNDIPEQCLKEDYWAVIFAKTWLATGLKASDAPEVKDKIDRQHAMGHIRGVMISSEIDAEYKLACLAYFLEQWFEKVEVNG